MISQKQSELISQKQSVVISQKQSELISQKQSVVISQKRSALITICCDFHQRQQLSPSEHVGVASQIQDYIPLRQRLRRALDEGKTYTVYVYSRILAHWLRDLRDYGPDLVRWEDVNSQREATLREPFDVTLDSFLPSELKVDVIDEPPSERVPALSPHSNEEIADKQEPLKSLSHSEQSLPFPPLPSEPDESWTAEAWLSWATEQYMPYFADTIRNHQGRERQMQLAERFADWLIKAYPDLSFDPNGPSLLFQQNEIHKSLKNNQSDVVLWLVIDGMTWWQAERLSFLCRERGLAIKQMRPTLSALPSITAISKRALAQGYLDAGTTTCSMARLFESQLAKKAPHVSVYTQVPELEALLRVVLSPSGEGTELRPGIYLLLYNALDYQNHNSTGFTDDESVEGHLKLMARLTDDFFQASQRQALSPVAFVSSDHGSTLLPSQAKTLKVPPLADFNPNGTEAKCSDELDHQEPESRPAQPAIRKPRAYALPQAAVAIRSTLNDEQISRLEADWYLLRAESYHLPTDYLIPKGYATVERRPRGWTHGGATPEETVVAFIELQPEAVKIIAPTVNIEGFLRLQKTTTLRVQLMNPNSLPLLHVELLIPQLQATMSCPSIAANSTSTHEIEVTASTLSSKGQVQSLDWQLRLRCGEQRCDFRDQVEVPIRRLQSSAANELFGEML